MLVSRLALFAQLASTLPMTGLIWLIQVVSYPLFARAQGPGFAAYHEAHTRLIGWVVGPLMLIEVCASLAWLSSRDVGKPVAYVGLGLVLLAWGVTGLCSVPMHNALSHGFDVRAHAFLVNSNWGRTLAWTLRSALLLYVMWERGAQAGQVQ
jgi:hypothetical protein